MRVLFTSIALAGLIAATPAAAQPGAEDFSVAIPYSDLNLASAAGLATFSGRVKSAAANVCIGAGDSPLQQTLQAQKCRANFKRTAEQQLQLALAPVGGRIFAAR